MEGGRPSSPQTMISPSSTAPRPRSAAGSSPSSGNQLVATFPGRLTSRSRPSITVAMARIPSHLTSAAHPSPSGTAPSLASIGASRGGATVQAKRLGMASASRDAPTAAASLQTPSGVADEELTVRQAADFLGLGLRTLYVEVERGELPSTRVGQQHRIRRSELEHYLGGARSNLATWST